MMLAPNPGEFSLQIDELSTNEEVIASTDQCSEGPKNGVMGTACGMAC